MGEPCRSSLTQTVCRPGCRSAWCSSPPGSSTQGDDGTSDREIANGRPSRARASRRASRREVALLRSAHRPDHARPHNRRDRLTSEVPGLVFVDVEHQRDVPSGVAIPVGPASMPSTGSPSARASTAAAHAAVRATNVMLRPSWTRVMASEARRWRGAAPGRSPRHPDRARRRAPLATRRSRLVTVPLQLPAKFRHRPSEPGVHGTDRQTEDRGDLRGRISEQVPQDDDGPTLRAEPGDRPQGRSVPARLGCRSLEVPGRVEPHSVGCVTIRL